jgi:hypothetical protein
VILQAWRVDWDVARRIAYFTTDAGGNAMVDLPPGTLPESIVAPVVAINLGGTYTNQYVGGY